MLIQDYHIIFNNFEHETPVNKYKNSVKTPHQTVSRYYKDQPATAV